MVIIIVSNPTMPSPLLHSRPVSPLSFYHYILDEKLSTVIIGFIRDNIISALYKTTQSPFHPLNGHDNGDANKSREEIGGLTINWMANWFHFSPTVRRQSFWKHSQVVVNVREQDMSSRIRFCSHLHATYLHTLYPTGSRLRLSTYLHFIILIRNVHKNVWYCTAAVCGPILADRTGRDGTGRICFCERSEYMLYLGTQYKFRTCVYRRQCIKTRYCCPCRCHRPGDNWIIPNNSPARTMNAPSNILLWLIFAVLVDKIIIKITIKIYVIEWWWRCQLLTLC